ncbi:MAG: hypothetical protein WB615_07875 [Candidatus Tumulicola sp.]
MPRYSSAIRSALRGPASTIPAAWPIAIALLCLTVIAPALWSGWLGDDAYYSALNGILGEDRIALFHAMWHSFDVWLWGNGRFYPGLVVEKYLVFALFTNLIAYKALLVVATIATVELFRRCVAAYATPWVATLSALVAVTLLSERGYQDAILAYNAMPQLVALATLGSMLAFRRVLERGDRFAGALAIALYAVAALTYEDAYGFALLYAGLARCRGLSWAEAVRRSAPFLAIGAGLAVVSLALRSAVHLPPGSLYAFNAAPFDVLRTFTDQVTAALPLSYWFFDPSHIYSRANFFDFYNNAPVQPLVFVAFAVATAKAIAECRPQGIRLSHLAAFGAALTVLAAAPIALTVKYQHELHPGLGYLPVFFEAFGVALVLAAAAAWTLRQKYGRAAGIAWIVAIACVGTMTQATNVRIVRENQPSKAARRALEEQLDRGLLANVPDGSALAVMPRFDWIVYDDAGPDGISTRGLFFLHGGKRIDLTAPGDARATNALSYDSQTRRWTVTCVPSARRPCGR